MSTASHKKLQQIAFEQGGYFTAKPAVACGIQTNNHPYFVKNEDWVLVYRGIYKMMGFPQTQHDDYILWSLWTQNRTGVPQGIISHESALAAFELSDVMPSKVHITVPKTFRKSAKTPKIVVLHKGEIDESNIEKRDGYNVTRPMQTIHDLLNDKRIELNLIEQAFMEGRQKGFITSKDINWSEKKSDDTLKQILEWEKEYWHKSTKTPKPSPSC